MGELSLSREGYTGYLGTPHELKVRLGDDVVVKCSASSSEEPSYFWYKEVRKPRERAQWLCPHYAFGNLSFSLSPLSPSRSVWPFFFFFYCPVFFHSHPVSAGFLPLFKHSLSFPSSFSVSLSDFVKPLVSPCPPSFHPLHRRSALYLSDRLAWAHHSLGIAACPLTED